MKEYKVLSQRDKRFLNSFDHETLETAINDLAAEKWEVVSMATSQAGVTGSSELIVLLTRDR